jgi:predicted glycosyltransferase
VLGLRDILDSPEETRRLWQRTGSYQAVEALYDRILVYGHRDMFDAGALYGFNASMAAKLVYCGYLAPAPVAAGGPDGGDGSHATEAPEIHCPPAGAGEAGEARDPRGPCGHLIVATAGGGADAFPLLRACVEALRQMVSETAPAPRAVLVAGPLMPERQRIDLRRLASGLPIEVHWQVDDVPALLATADAVVAMAGYNTLVEAVAARRRIVAVPRRGPSAEQSMRADLFRRHGLVDVVPPDQLSAATLAAAIRRAVAAPPPPPFAMDGRNAVLRELTLLWEGRRAAEPVAAYGSLPTAVPPPQGAASSTPRPVHASPAP